MLTSYLLSASVSTPLTGRLGDMYGNERLLMIVLALRSSQRRPDAAFGPHVVGDPAESTS